MTAQPVAEAPPEVPYVLTSKGVEVRQPDGSEGSRWYVDPETGDLLASVTTAISSNSSKPWLTTWAAKLAAETAIEEHDLIAQMLATRIEDVELTEAQFREKVYERRQGAIDYLKGAAKRKRDAASERGTWVHDVVEALILDTAIPDVPEDVKPYLDSFINWWCDFDPRPFMSEATVADPRAGWAGTLDLAAFFRSLRVSGVVDVKTGANLDIDMRVQMSAYRRAKEVWLPLGVKAPMPRTDRAYVLWLGTDWYKMIDVTDESGECYEQFLSLLERTRWRDRQGKRIGRAIYPPLADGSQPPPLLEDIDGIPAVTKFVTAGVVRLDDLLGKSARELFTIPGVGPGAIRALPEVCATWGQAIDGLDDLIAELDAKDAEKAERAAALTAKRAIDHGLGKHTAKPIKACRDCTPEDPEDQHFHGCPTPVGPPFECDYCQDRSASMAGEG